MLLREATYQITVGYLRSTHLVWKVSGDRYYRQESGNAVAVKAPYRLSCTFAVNSSIGSPEASLPQPHPGLHGFRQTREVRVQGSKFLSEVLGELQVGRGGGLTQTKKAVSLSCQTKPQNCLARDVNGSAESSWRCMYGAPLFTPIPIWSLTIFES